ncbi:MAG: hypothetical protein NTW49_01820 [Bacteroidia bacterium]|nr:hypothetical protein [Bacteroidia bacterium]
MRKQNLKIIAGTSLAFILCFLLFSALVMFGAPKGELAEGWKFLGISYPMWLSYFVILLITFFCLLIIFLYQLNIRELWTNFRSFRPDFFMSRDFWISIAFILVILTGTGLRIFPFKTIMQAGHFFAREPELKGMIKDTSNLKLSDAASRFGLSPAQVTGKLQFKGIIVKGEDPTLLEIARGNNLTIGKVYDVIARGETTVAGGSDTLKGKELNQGQGNPGEVDAVVAAFAEKASHMTLNDLLALINKRQKLNITINDMVKRLEDNFVLVKSHDQTIGDIASSNKLKVQEVLNVISTGNKDKLLKPGQGMTQNTGNTGIGNQNNIQTNSRPQDNKADQQDQNAGGRTRRAGKSIADKSLNDLAVERNLNIDVMIRALKNEGITADKSQTIEQIAKRNNRKPQEITGILKKAVKGR